MVQISSFNTSTSLLHFRIRTFHLLPISHTPLDLSRDLHTRVARFLSLCYATALAAPSLLLDPLSVHLATPWGKRKHYAPLFDKLNRVSLMSRALCNEI